jgi:hypothetical protein
MGALTCKVNAKRRRYAPELTYSILIASTGHSSTQTPQSTHLSVSTQALPLFIAIASLGQHSKHDSQPVQVSFSTFAGIFYPFLNKIKRISIRGRIYKKYPQDST